MVRNVGVNKDKMTTRVSRTVARPSWKPFCSRASQVRQKAGRALLRGARWSRHYPIPIIKSTTSSSEVSSTRRCAHKRAFIKNGDPVTSAKNILQAMSNKNDGDALAAQSLDQRQNLLHFADCQRGGRFVENQQFRLEGDRPADGDRLALAA